MVWCVALLVLHDSCPDLVFEVLAEHFEFFVGPVDVRVLSGIEVEFLEHVFSARVDYGDIESECKTCFEVYASACAVISVSHVGDQEARLADFCNDLIIYFAEVVFPVGSIWFESSRLYSGGNSVIVNRVHFLVEPHRDKCLSRIDGG